MQTISALFDAAQNILYGLFGTFVAGGKNVDRPYPAYMYSSINNRTAMTERPNEERRTFVPTQTPHLKHLNGRLEDHIVTRPEYKDAYMQRKMGSYYNTDTSTQISPYHYRPWQNEQVRYLDGTTVHRQMPTDDPAPDTFYSTVKAGAFGRSVSRQKTILYLNPKGNKPNPFKHVL